MMYGGKPTKWWYLQEYQKLRKEMDSWRPQVVKLVKEGRLPLTALKEEFEFDNPEDIRRVDVMLERANKSKNPYAYLKERPTWHIRIGYQELLAMKANIEKKVEELKSMPIGLTPGFRFNSEWGLNIEEVSAAADDPKHFLWGLIYV